MIIAQTLHSQIVKRARELLAKREDAPPRLEEKTEMMVKLDKFFSVKRFCEHHDVARELVGVITGYTPEGIPEPSSQLFSVLHCRSGDALWLLLDGTHGFGSLEQGKYTRQVGCETDPPIEDAKSFIDDFALIDSQAFANWCLKNMPDLKWALKL